MPLSSGILIAVIAFFSEFVDSSLGMGYGTILTPVLLLMGYSPLEIVPSVLLSEFATGVVAGFTHHRMGNVDFTPRSTNVVVIARRIRELGYVKSFTHGVPRHLKIALLLALCSIVGTIGAVLLAVRLPKNIMVMIIGLIIFSMGLVIFFTRNKEYPFSWKKITGLGLLASFNKGLSGGGYGPIVTGGQLLAGVETKSTIGITSLAEGLTCLTGVIMYWITVPHVSFTLAPYNVTGALLSVPFAVLAVKKINERKLKVVIGVVTLLLGLLTLTKTLSP
ncbi:MAG TPA: sulfite exporter TauE/SafE family protein [bacterium]|nr:sulfite exporter TauE/SafE family protein [bacterium]